MSGSDESYLYDSIEAETYPRNAPLHNVQDSFNYDYVDVTVNGDLSHMTTERYYDPHPTNSMNSMSYHQPSYPTHGDSMMYDSLDPTYDSRYQDPYGGYPAPPNVNYGYPDDTIMRDSLDPDDGTHDFSRFEDLNELQGLLQMPPHNQGSQPPTISEQTMSFASDQQYANYSDRPYNNDADAHMHAMNIQSHYRGYNTRKNHAFKEQQPRQRRQEYPNDSYVDDSRYQDQEETPRNQPQQKTPTNHPQQNDAANYHATKIQAGYRGYKTRKEMRQKAAQRNEDDYATDIQAAARGRNTRKLQQQDEAAVVIQKNYRGYKTRQEMHKSKQAQREPNMDEEATKVQAAARGRQSRKKAKEENAAVIIQSNYRGYKTRKGLVKEKPTEEPAVHQTRPDKYEQAATKIQVNYRGYKTRRELKEKDQAATQLQANAKGYRERQTMAEKNAHATAIQSGYRGYKTREKKAKELSEKDASATAIQAQAKGFQSRKRAKEQEQAAIAIQANYRGYRTREEQKAATAIQAHAKGYNARKNQVEDDDDIDEAAAIIQAGFRGYQTRKKMTEQHDSQDEEDEEEEEAATILQAGAKGYQARKEKEEEENAATTLQAHVKGRNSRKEVEKKDNTESDLEAAWDKNRRNLQKGKKETQHGRNMNPGKPEPPSRKYTEYLDHSRWAARQDKKKVGLPVSKAPSMAPGAMRKPGNAMRRKSPSQKSTVSFSEPYTPHDTRAYPKSPIPSPTSTSSSSRDSSQEGAKSEREQLKRKILKEEPPKRKPGQKPKKAQMPTKEELREEILHRQPQPADMRAPHPPPPANQKQGRKSRDERRLLPQPSSSTIATDLEDVESLYEFENRVNQVQQREFKSKHKDPTWYRPKPQQYEEEEEDDVDYEEEPYEDDDSEDQYMPPPQRARGQLAYNPGYPGQQPYGQYMPPHMYPPGYPPYGYPPMHPQQQVAFVPVPWDNLHPLQQTLLASQYPGAIAAVDPAGGSGDTKPAGKEQAPKKSLPPEKDFISKNLAVKKEQPKGSYKKWAAKKGVVKEPANDEEHEDDQPKKGNKKPGDQNGQKSDQVIQTRSSLTDNNQIKVDINLNIPPEQLAAMLGIDPSMLTPRQNFKLVADNPQQQVRGSKDRSPMRVVPKERSPLRAARADVSPLRHSHEQQLQNPRGSYQQPPGGGGGVPYHDPRNSYQQHPGEPLVNNYVKPKAKEPNPYTKMPPIRQQQENGGRDRSNDRRPHHSPPPQPRPPVQYKPYTLEEYKALNLNVKLPAGLGPDPESIERRRRPRERQEEYARRVKEQNMTTLSTKNQFAKPDHDHRRLSRRKIGMEYAKSVPKPKPMIKEEVSDSESNPQPPESRDSDRLQMLKQRHDHERSQVNAH